MKSMDYKIRIAVCDDEKKDCIEIVSMVMSILQKECISYTVTAYDHAKELLDDIKNGDLFQILILDVLMDEMDGMELARELRKLEINAAIVFVSGNREMALCGYEVSAARYLEKPLDEEKLKEALLYCIGSKQTKREILIPTAQGQRRISVSDIQYAEAFDRGARFVLDDEKVECRLKFGEVGRMLPKSMFLLCHRAYIVNLSCVKFIRNYEFELKNGWIVPIGKGRYADVYKTFVSYLTD